MREADPPSTKPSKNAFSTQYERSSRVEFHAAPHRHHRYWITANIFRPLSPVGLPVCQQRQSNVIHHGGWIPVD